VGGVRANRHLDHDERLQGLEVREAVSGFDRGERDRIRAQPVDDRSILGEDGRCEEKSCDSAIQKLGNRCHSLQPSGVNSSKRQMADLERS